MSGDAQLAASACPSSFDSSFGSSERRHALRADVVEQLAVRRRRRRRATTPARIHTVINDGIMTRKGIGSRRLRRYGLMPARTARSGYLGGAACSIVVHNSETRLLL